MTTTATITEVSAQRKNARSTTSTTSFNITLAATPTAGDVLVVTRSCFNGASTINPPTYGGTTFTAATTLMTIGSGATLLQMQVFYCVTNSTNISSGGTTVNSTQTAVTASIGWSVTAMRGVSPTNPIDLTSVNSGTASGSFGPFSGGLSNNLVHNAQGASALMFVTVNGALTVTGAVYNPPGSGGAGGIWWPLSATTTDITGINIYFLNDAASEVMTSGPYFTANAASRNYCCGWVAFNPSTYAPTSRTTAISEVVADSVAPATTSAQTGASTVISEVVADSTAPATTDTVTGAEIIESGAVLNQVTAVTDTTLANVISLSSTTSGGQASGSVSVAASSLVMAIVAGNPTGRLIAANKPGSVKVRSKILGSVGVSTKQATVRGKTKTAGTVGINWKVQQ